MTTIINLPIDILSQIVAYQDAKTFANFICSCKYFHEQYNHKMEEKAINFGYNKLHMIISTIIDAQVLFMKEKEVISKKILQQMIDDYQNYPFNGVNINVLNQISNLLSFTLSKTRQSFNFINNTWKKVLKKDVLSDDETLVWKCFQQFYFSECMMWDVMFVFNNIYWWLNINCETQKLQFHMNDVVTKNNLFKSGVWNKLNVKNIRVYSGSAVLELPIDKNNIDSSIMDLTKMVSSTFGYQILFQKPRFKPALSVFSQDSYNENINNVIENTKHYQSFITNLVNSKLNEIEKILKSTLPNHA
jgi:hypothetical protein